jgi:hypothetical protein
MIIDNRLKFLQSIVRQKIKGYGPYKFNLAQEATLRKDVVCTNPLHSIPHHELPNAEMYFILVALILFAPTCIHATLNGPCFVGDTPGVCLHTAKCRARQGTPTRKYCEGDPTDVQCCTKTFCADGGNCRFDSQCFGGRPISSHCPGPSDFRCCLDQQPSGFPLYGVNEVNMFLPISYFV